MRLKKPEWSVKSEKLSASQGKKTLVLAMGHMPYTFIGRFEDARWAKLVDFEYNGHKDQVTSQKAEGALVLRLGYYGEAPDTDEGLNAIRQSWERVHAVPRQKGTGTGDKPDGEKRVGSRGSAGIFKV